MFSMLMKSFFLQSVLSIALLLTGALDHSIEAMKRDAGYAKYNGLVIIYSTNLFVFITTNGNKNLHLGTSIFIYLVIPNISNFLRI